MKQFHTELAFSLILLLSGIPIAHAADIIETATETGTLKSFIVAIKKTDLAEMLKTAGPYTVFAPSDKAFEKLPKEKWSEISKDKNNLAVFLARYIVPGKILIADVRPGKTDTIRGASIHLSSDNGKVTVDGANVTQSDIIADNGVIHEIDTVIFSNQENDRSAD